MFSYHSQRIIHVIVIPGAYYLSDDQISASSHRMFECTCTIKLNSRGNFLFQRIRETEEWMLVITESNFSGGCTASHRYPIDARCKSQSLNTITPKEIRLMFASDGRIRCAPPRPNFATKEQSRCPILNGIVCTEYSVADQSILHECQQILAQIPCALPFSFPTASGMSKTSTLN